MPIAAGLGGPAVLVDNAGVEFGTPENPISFTAAPAGAATIADGTDVAEGAIADAAATAGGVGTVSAKLRVISGTLGATADAAATAGSTGSLSAKLRVMSASLGAVADAADTTPAADSTVISLLKGILTILEDVWDDAGHTIKTS